MTVLVVPESDGLLVWDLGYSARFEEGDVVPIAAPRNLMDGLWRVVGVVMAPYWTADDGWGVVDRVELEPVVAGPWLAWCALSAAAAAWVRGER